MIEIDKDLGDGWGIGQTGNGWYENSSLSHNGKQVLSVEANENGFCCGLTEIGNFVCEPVRITLPTPILKEYIQYQASSVAFYHLTLTRMPKKRTPVQPKWFVDAVRGWEGATHTKWKLNVNSGNEIQMWVLPT